MFARGVGMVTAVGGCAKQTYTSIMAKLSRVEECKDLYYCMAEDPDFDVAEPLNAARLYFLKKSLPSHEGIEERLAAIGAVAFQDLTDDLGGSPDTRTTALLLSLPEPRPGWTADKQRQFLYHFHNKSRVDFFAHEEMIFSGRTGGLECLARASALLEGNTVGHVIIGGIESYLHMPWLQDFDEKYRIRSVRNRDGYIPGEGAAFVCVSKEPSGHRNRNGIVQLGCGRHASYSGPLTDLYTGKVLTDLLRSDQGQFDTRSSVFCDLNGESPRMKEWAYTTQRLREMFTDATPIVMPVISTGDLGAASSVMLLGTAIQHLQGNATETQSLVWTAGDNGQRSSVLLNKFQ